MAITYPLLHPPTPGFRSITMRARDLVARSTSPFTGQQQVYAHPGQWWEADVALPPMNQDGAADEWAAWLTALRGGYGTFLLGDSSRKTPRGSAVSGAPAVAGGSQTGSTLATGAWPASQSGLLLPGDYIQLGGQNLILQSEDFANAAWTKSAVTVTANDAVSPIGTTTADKLTSSSSLAYAFQSVTLSDQLNQQVTFSAWLKSTTGTFLCDLAADNPLFATTARSTVTLTTSWQRFSVTLTPTIAGAYMFYIGVNAGFSSGKELHAWGAQLNLGPSPDGYYPTTSAATTVTRRLHKVLRTVNSDGSGNANIEIWPRLRESPAANTRLKFINPVGTFRLADNTREWSVDEAKIYGISFSAVEAI